MACIQGLQSVWKIAFFPSLEVGRWHSDIGSTVDPPTLQLGFLSLDLSLGML